MPQEDNLAAYAETLDDLMVSIFEMDVNRTMFLLRAYMRIRLAKVFLVCISYLGPFATLGYCASLRSSFFCVLSKKRTIESIPHCTSSCDVVGCVQNSGQLSKSVANGSIPSCGFMLLKW